MITKEKEKLVKQAGKLYALGLTVEKRYVNLVRDTIEKKYRPGEHNRHIRTLNAAHINEDEYFRHVVHDDMDGIIRGMKEIHKKDRVNAPETDFVQELKQDLEFVSSIEDAQKIPVS